MRSRLAVLSLLSLSIASIACVPRAEASPPEAAVQAPEFQPEKTYIVSLEEHPIFYITMGSPGVIRVTHGDSAGHPLLKVEIARLPNPAKSLITPIKRLDRQASSGSDNSAGLASNSSNYVERSSYDPLPLPVRNSDRKHSQRLSSGLRDAALIGTLVSQGRLKRS